jgi:methionyl-tRNA formyltransferase
MRVIFMGTPDFAVPVLDALVAADHEIICVVAQPDRPKGRGHKLVSPPTVMRARELGIPVRQPKAVRRGPFVDWMTTADADVAVVVAYGRILIPTLLDAPKHGCINVHASLLPKYRGAAPINWAVVRGETETGVTTMAMAEGLDTGDMLLESRTLIGENETAGELYQRLSTMGASLAVETLATLSEIRPRPQEHSAHTLAPLIDRSLAEIDWTQDAQTIHNLIRGFHPWPTAWTTLAGERLKVHSSRVVDASGSAGTIIKADKTVVVAAAQGGIALNMVQLAGKRAQPGRDLVNSGRIKEGMTLGQEA